MVREIIIFEVPLGPESDVFRDAFRRVEAAMVQIGVEPGKVWFPMTGDGRRWIIEREFASLGEYEADDERFHEARDFMQLWREMESHASSMRVELWQR
jgi:hypothetical protein